MLIIKEKAASKISLRCYFFFTKNSFIDYTVLFTGKNAINVNNFIVY
nr:MAG TPA: hypothetical protein [Inoviridae sp.]